MLGRAAVTMWWKISPEMQAEFEDWHSREHMPERLAIPGFLRGSRWVAQAGEPSYFVLYEAARLSTITSGPYIERLNNPTPWSRKMMPHHRDMVRSLCRIRATFGGGVPHALATMRFSPRSAQETKRLASDVMPDIAGRKGVTGVHLLQSEAMTGSATAEQEIRGGDAVADWVMLIGGYDAAAVGAAVKAMALPEAKSDAYRLSYCRTAGDRT